MCGMSNILPLTKVEFGDAFPWSDCWMKYAEFLCRNVLQGYAAEDPHVANCFLGDYYWQCLRLRGGGQPLARDGQLRGFSTLRSSILLGSQNDCSTGAARNQAEIRSPTYPRCNLDFKHC